MGRVEVQCPAAVGLELETRWESFGYDVIDVGMDQVGVQGPAAVGLELETAWESSGYDVIDV